MEIDKEDLDKLSRRNYLKKLAGFSTASLLTIKSVDYESEKRNLIGTNWGGKTLESTFQWSNWRYGNGNKKFSLKFKAPQELYKYYKTDRNRSRNYTHYSSNQLQKPYIKKFTNKIVELSKKTKTPAHIIAIDIIQNLEYNSGDKHYTKFTEYPKFSLETLIDKKGDCEDTVILMSSILENLGHKTLYVILPKANHMLLAAKLPNQEKFKGDLYFKNNGEKYTAIETTGPSILAYTSVTDEYKIKKIIEPPETSKETKEIHLKLFDTTIVQTEKLKVVKNNKKYSEYSIDTSSKKSVLGKFSHLLSKLK